MATPPEVAPSVADDRLGGPSERSGSSEGTFTVHLDNFSGPFDLLLSLIAKHKLDITEIALARVTDEFIAYIRAADLNGRNDSGTGRTSWDLSIVSEFLVVAATLLDLKAARLLPSGAVEDAEDLELLEARDLLFARLLQYRAYKGVAATIAERLADEAQYFPRAVGLEPQLAALLPELVWNLGPEDFARLAARALGPKPPPPGIGMDHLHAPAISVREQAAIVMDKLRRGSVMSFRALVVDAESMPVVVARFLALLELFREGVIAFDQAAALGELTVRWVADASQDDLVVATEFDETLEAKPAASVEGTHDRGN